MCYIGLRLHYFTEELSFFIGQASLEGTGSPVGLRYFLYVWTDVGINKLRWWFLNF